MILCSQNGSRNQGEVGGNTIDLFWGGGSPKSLPKSKIFGSVFSYLKVADGGKRRMCVLVAGFSI